MAYDITKIAPAICLVTNFQCTTVTEILFRFREPDFDTIALDNIKKLMTALGYSYRETNDIGDVKGNIVIMTDNVALASMDYVTHRKVYGDYDDNKDIAVKGIFVN